MEASPEFLIKCGSDTFKSKQRDIFDILANIEKDVNLPKNQHEDMEVDAGEQRHRAKKHRSRTKALRGQESIFKMPGSPPHRPRMPDHRRNPNRWTKYSLADVAPDDMSEASNTAAAMDFLRTLKEQVPESREDLPSRVFFNRSVQKRRQRQRTDDVESSSDNDSVLQVSPLPQIGFGDKSSPIEETPPVERPVFRQNKLVMPEYVIGEKVAKPKKMSKKPKEMGKELNLSHLLEEDE